MAQPREAFGGSPPPSCHNIQNVIKVLTRINLMKLNNQELAQETQKEEEEEAKALTLTGVRFFQKIE